MNDILKQLSIFLIFLSISLPVFSWLLSSSHPYFAYLMAIPFFLMMFIRETFASLFIFILGHLAIIAGVYFLPFEFNLKILIMACSVLFLIFSFYDRLTEMKSGLTMAFLFLSAAVNIAAGLISAAFGLAISNLFFVGNMLITILCYFLFCHNSDIGLSLEAITLTSSQPVKSIKRFNNAAIGIFLSLAVILSMFAGILPVRAILSGLGNGLLDFIRYLFSLGSRETVYEYVETAPLPMDQGMSQLHEMFEARDPFFLWVVLERVLIFLMVTAAIVGVIVLIIYLSYMLYKKFYARSIIQSDIKEFVAPEVNIESIAARLFDFLPAFGFSPEHKIRKQFYKKVKKHIKNGIIIQKSDTAKEIAQIIKEKENIDMLTNQYEEIRYK